MVDNLLSERVLKLVQRDEDVDGFQLKCNARCTTKAGKIFCCFFDYQWNGI